MPWTVLKNIERLIIMNILGIKPYGHDPAASIVVDDKIVAAVEEERFVRVKHALNFFPFYSIIYCLNEANLSMKDIDYVTLPINPKLYINSKLLKMVGLSLPYYLRPKNALMLAMREFTKYVRYIRTWEIEFKRYFGVVPKVRYVEHHLAHACSAYYLSGFKKSNIITIDGAGEVVSTLLAVGKGKEIEKIKEIYLPHSLGLLYVKITELLGFKSYDEEGKVMGLAAYGKPIIDFSPIIKIGEGNYKVDYDKLKFKPRLRDEPLNNLHKNIAASIQSALGKTVTTLAEYLYDLTGIKNLCLAGGVSLNADMNKILLGSDFCEKIFIQPAAHDPGSALGAALYNTDCRFELDSAALGPKFSNEDIKPVLDESKITYEKIDDISGYVGEELLPEGKIVGWFQGRMEFGPRALGSRSILADPSNPDTKDNVNNSVKHREPWRPFAPSILFEHRKRYFSNGHKSPFMILTFDLANHQEELISAAHVDNTVRPQTVDKNSLLKYHRLINKFYKVNGVPAVLNTSFNVAGEPIVCNPRDALRTFYGSGLDYLAIGDYLISKRI